MYSTFVKYEFQHTYDAILAAPVDTEELVTGEALWIAARTGVYGCVPMLVAMVFGLDPSWGMLLVPFIAALAGLGWACFGIFIAAKAKAIESFSYWQSGLLTPMFLVAGTFFPLDRAARVGAGRSATSTRSTTASSSSAHAVFGFEGWADVGHVAFLVGFALVSWRLAIQLHGAQADPLNQTSLLWVLVAFFGGSVLFGGLRRLTEDSPTGVVIAVQLGALAAVTAVIVIMVRRLR